MGSCVTCSRSPPLPRLCLALSAPADASPYVRYGLQDDAWLAYGPGTLDERIDTLDGMGVTLVRYTLDWSTDRAAPRGVRLGPGRRDPARV